MATCAARAGRSGSGAEAPPLPGRDLDGAAAGAETLLGGTRREGQAAGIAGTCLGGTAAGIGGLGEGAGGEATAALLQMLVVCRVLSWPGTRNCRTLCSRSGLCALELALVEGKSNLGLAGRCCMAAPAGWLLLSTGMATDRGMLHSMCAC